MPDILPFRAIHYPWNSDFSRLTAPPYDVISPGERDSLIAAHDNNVIRVTLGGDHSGEDEKKYQKAGSRLRDWLASGILIQDPEPLFFLYGMTYSEDGERKTTLGLLASLGLEEFGAGQIFPHERTIPGPIQDRLHLLRSTEANLEPLWFFASSRVAGFRQIMERTKSEPPLAQVTDSADVAHELWPVDPTAALQLRQSIAATPLVIADGHHRYETALAFREERRSADGPGPWDETLALIVDPVDYPPLLKPIHRLTQGLSVGQITELAYEASGNGSVPLERMDNDLNKVVRRVEEEGPGTIGIVTVRGAWIITTNAELDTSYLNDNILEPTGASVRYEHDPKEVEAMLADGVVAFILAPAPIDLVASKALAGERMPPKTTLFWPKPRSGFVMRDLRR